MTNEKREEYIKALIQEREGYVRTGDEAHTAAVDAELKRVGHEAKPPAKRAQTRKR